MNRKDIEFDAEELAGSVEAFAAHVEAKKKLTLRSNQMSMEQVKPALEPKTPGTATVEMHRPLLDKPAGPHRHRLRQRAAALLYTQEPRPPQRSPQSPAGSAGSP
jgi:hypothetical protein